MVRSCPSINANCSRVGSLLESLASVTWIISPRTSIWFSSYRWGIRSSEGKYSSNYLMEGSLCKSNWQLEECFPLNSFWIIILGIIYVAEMICIHFWCFDLSGWKGLNPIPSLILPLLSSVGRRSTVSLLKKEIDACILSIAHAQTKTRRSAAVFHIRHAIRRACRERTSSLLH